MLKKVVFVILITMFMALGASSAFALEIPIIDGLAPYGIDGYATSVNPGGLGDALVYGYYNVRGNVNLFNIVNTDSFNGVKARVQFRAGKTSEEVLDFSVCLSDNDVWTAYLIDNGTTAEICPIYDQTTPTAPAIPSTCQPFKIPSGSSLTNDDLREGYFEVLGFTTIPGFDENSPAGTCPSASKVDCITTSAQCASWGTSSNFNESWAVGNTLMGNNAIADISTLQTYSYNAAAIMYTTLLGYEDPGPGQNVYLTSVADMGCELEYVIAKSNVISPYDITTSLAGQTALILNFPTRRSCHLDDASGSSYDNIGESSASVEGNLFGCTANSGSWPSPCTAYATPIVVTAYDDEEHSLNILNFSPSGATTLPYEVNVLEIGSSSIWNSSLASSISVGSFQVGWMNISLAQGNALQGLPALSFKSQTYMGGASYIVPTAYISPYTEEVDVE